MIRDLVLESEGEDDELFRNETLPGTVKSQYALKFRLDTDKANANFMQVSGGITDRFIIHLFHIPITQSVSFYYSVKKRSAIKRSQKEDFQYHIKRMREFG